ncbi:hypothetical protein QUF90_00165 [Desulfococcaceae bacterium HSG9]|nr:hypothetical protein [Desulfococcaceae bacterium HSG9]
MLKKFALLIFILGFSTGFASAESIIICTDRANWYPFTFRDKGHSAGIHVDIVTKALVTIGYQPVFTPLAWKKCLEKTGTGSYNALVSGSYKAKRAKSLIYPPDATTALKSKWRIMQVEYVLITPAANSYKYNGDVKTLPIPVRAPLGYSIVDDLRAKGLKVITNNTKRNLKSIDRMQKGCVITPPENAARLIKALGLGDRLKIHPKPVKSKSYFMLFSKKATKFDPPEIQKIWDEIAKLRDDEQFMQQLFEKYD